MIKYHIFPGRGHEEEITKNSVNITILRLQMEFFTNSRAKKDNFTITTGIANHDFTSIFSRVHVLFSHMKNLYFTYHEKLIVPQFGFVDL